MRHYLKCEVCESIILLRVQVGWLNYHPIKIHCGKCGIMISGNAYFDQENVTTDFKFENVIHESHVTPDFYIEASGELLTEKLQEYKNEDNASHILPPFFKNIKEMGYENYELFKKNVNQFIYSSKEDWPKIRRINELWLSGNYSFLQQELKQILPIKQFPCNNELEYLRGVHHINLWFFLNVLDHNEFKSTTEFLWEEITTLSKTSQGEILKLSKRFTENGIFTDYEKKIFDIMIQFVYKFQYMIPAYSLGFFTEVRQKLFIIKGITTATFDDLKQFYLDSYEVIVEIANLIIACNNVVHRGNIKKIVNKRRDVTDFEDLNKISKGDKLNFIEGNEKFDQLIYTNLNNKLRNAIGHNSYKYDGINQLITYYPKGTVNTSHEYSLYLLEFVRECYNLFQTINNINELIYQLRKIYCLYKGDQPVSLDHF